MAESNEELKGLLMKVKEESEKAVLKLNIQKMKIMASCHIPSWHIDGGKVERVTSFPFLGSKMGKEYIKGTCHLAYLTYIHHSQCQAG